MKRKKEKHFQKPHRKDRARYPQTVFRIPTPDDWYPTFEDGTVKVMVSDLTMLWGYPGVRIHASGGDDFALEIDFTPDSQGEASRIYREWVREGPLE
jgi:hypothetical protein